MTILFSPRAGEDLLAPVEFISEGNPAVATRLSNRVFAVVERLASGEFDGRIKVLRSGQRVRSRPVPPLRVYPQRGRDVLKVLRIYHQRRRPI